METHHDNINPIEGGDEKRNKDTRLSTIRGIVIPVGWDEKGNVDAAAISTYDEDEYLIDNHDKGRELLALIREEVEVSGILREEKNRLIMKIKEYRLKPGLISVQNSIKRNSRIRKK